MKRRFGKNQDQKREKDKKDRERMELTLSDEGKVAPDSPGHPEVEPVLLRLVLQVLVQGIYNKESDKLCYRKIVQITHENPQNQR